MEGATTDEAKAGVRASCKAALKTARETRKAAIESAMQTRKAAIAAIRGTS